MRKARARYWSQVSLTLARTKVSRKIQTGRNPTAKEIQEAERIAALHPEQQRHHPSSVPADHSKLAHVNTYGLLPDYYIDKPFTCRDCGKREIWKADSQKWYYEEAKGHIDATAVLCHDCRMHKSESDGSESSAS